MEKEGHENNVRIPICFLSVLGRGSGFKYYSSCLMIYLSFYMSIYVVIITIVQANCFCVIMYGYLVNQHKQSTMLQ